MFKKYSNQLLYFGVAIIFFLSFASVYGIQATNTPMAKLMSFNREREKVVKPTIRKDTSIKQEIGYLCGDKVTTDIPTTSDLVGADFTSLTKKYPPKQGWVVDDTVENTLKLVRLEQRVCPYHQDFRHLGIVDDYLVVFEGPLGYNQKVLQREDIIKSSLPPEMQNELSLAMDYDAQAPDIQARLKTAYEFETEAQLNLVLENFDEYRE